MRLPEPPSAGGGPADLAALVRRLQADPRPRLTWYGPDGARVELTGRVLVTWVAKTAHLLAEEADVVPGSRVAVRLGADWRAPVFWLAAGYLGAEVHDAGAGPAGGPPPGAGGTAGADVEVVGQDEVLGTGAAGPTSAAVRVVVPHEAVAAPLPGLPAGCVDYGGEVSGFPDVLPAPGPRAPLATTDGPARRVLLGPGATAGQVLAAWAAGGSVVLHTGLGEQALARVAEQERTDA